MIALYALVLAFLPMAAGDAEALFAPAAAPGAAAPAAQSAPKPGFVAVEGATLRARVAEALSRGRASGAPRFWVAYGFDVRPGVAIDVEYSTKGGKSVCSDGFNVNTGSGVETRNLAVFALYARGAERPERLQIYNLDRARDYDRLPVYWAGRAPSGESFEYLQSLLAAGGETAERAVAAIAVHDDARASDILEGLARSGADERARLAAVTWLGIRGERNDFLAGIVRDEREPRKLREHAATALGIGGSPTAVATLRGLYSEVREREVRQHVLTAVAIHGGRGDGGDDAEAVDFIVEVAGSEPDRELRRHALFWLSQKAGARALGVLESAVDSPDESVAEHAVFAISQRPKDEAIPVLIRVAREHRSPEVRKKAIFWLGQIDDERAFAFLRELVGR